MSKIFMSVPDGAYWRLKEERERAKEADRRKRDEGWKEGGLQAADEEGDQEEG